MNADELLAFEEEIAKEFEAGKIRAPVHLGGGNEAQLIEIFENVQPDDWVLCGWRSHYHCLLKGVPPAVLRDRIMRGHSISLCFPRQKILCSGIVGGIAPWAVGLAWSLKEKNALDVIGHDTRVWCFLGDMSAEAGIVHESMKYAARHALPVRWIIEDNGKSVCTDTIESWGNNYDAPHVYRYAYDLTRPHVGIGKWVRF